MEYLTPERWETEKKNYILNKMIKEANKAINSIYSQFDLEEMFVNHVLRAKDAFKIIVLN